MLKLTNGIYMIQVSELENAIKREGLRKETKKGQVSI